MAGITYVDAADAVAGFFDSIAQSRELAIDTEGASFHRFVDRVYLLQLSTRERDVILDPLAVSPPPELGRLVADPGVEVVFHDADYDLRLLRKDYGWRIGRLFDTRVAAQLLGIRQFGLAALLEQHFGVRLDKRHQRADWSMRPLTDAMIAYAAQDTRHLLSLRDLFRDRLSLLGRVAWAEEEFERVRGVEWAADETREAFLRLKGARDLDRRALAILRELVAWRDRIAAAADRATFRIIANEALLEIARRAPQSVDDLQAIRGLPRNLSSARAADLLAAVGAGQAIPESELPKFPRAPRWDRDPNFDSRVAVLRTARDAVAARLDLDSGVLCSRERLEAVARRAPDNVDELATVAELRRWQVEVLGDEFVRALKRA